MVNVLSGQTPEARGGPTDYSIHMEAAHGFLELIDVPRMVSQCTDRWFNQTLCRVNDCVARLGVFQGEFHWHSHESEDEMFFVLEGELLVDLEDGTLALARHQGFTVPRGVRHRTRAPGKTVVLMIEGRTVVPTGS